MPSLSKSQELIAWLKDYDNPFDGFVQPDYDTSRLQWHVPAINKEIYDCLKAVIDRYRTPDQNVPRSGAVVVFGSRGAGKTHLRKVLEDDASALVITPARLEIYRETFAEFLLIDLVRFLQNEFVSKAGGALVDLANGFTRRVLAQAIYTMTEREWLEHHLPSKTQQVWRGLLRFGLDPILQRRVWLLENLEKRQDAVRDICQQAKSNPDLMRQLAVQHVVETQVDRTIRSQIRQHLYRHLVELAFAPEQTDIFEFMLNGLTKYNRTPAASRSTLVDELFRALIELFLLFEKPVVFIFDDLERLFRPEPQKELCEFFFEGLVEVIEAQPGVPFFVFAESGHWQKASHYLHEYAARRLDQGLPARGFGSLWRLTMPNIKIDDVRQLIHYRMRELLRVCEQDGVMVESAIAPFQEAHLEAIIRSDIDLPPLRQIFQKLRDQYNEIVFDFRPSVSISETSALKRRAPDDLYRSRWEWHVNQAKRDMDKNRLSLYTGGLYAGLDKWLQHLIQHEERIARWMLIEAEPKPFSDHPDYGWLVKSTWRGDAEVHQLGIALLLGQRNAMPIDMDIKLDMMTSSHLLVDTLLILWPRNTNFTGEAFDQLRGSTRARWDRYQEETDVNRIHLSAIEPSDLATLLALEQWDQEMHQREITEKQLHPFVSEQTSFLKTFINLPST